MENGEFVDQRRAAIEGFLARHRERLKRQGVIVSTYRFRNGRRLGPYFRLAYRIDGRQTSIYLGLAGPLVDEVRSRLAALQAPQVNEQHLRQTRRALRRQAAEVRRGLDVELKPLGLFRKGNEVRGWRSLRRS